MAELSSTINHDDDEDYMGDLSKFLDTQQQRQTLKNPKKQPSKSTNPSYQPSKKIPRSHVSWHEQKRAEKERKILEEDQKTLENLTAAIPQSNIGFKMLQQMGYTPGLGLGKDGRVDPIGVEIRRSRAGIGSEDPAKARLRKEKEKMEREKERMEREKRGEVELLEEFGVRRRKQWKVKRVVASYHKAKAVLDGLENREVVVAEKEEEEVDDVEEEEEVITEEDLHEILAKLREEHRYCLFCGCQFETAEALLSNCPGLTEDDH